MVRGMMDDDGGGGLAAAAIPSDRNGPPGAEGKAQVVVGGGVGGKSATYVGATHFMAMLDDVSSIQFAFGSASSVLIPVFCFITWDDDESPFRPLISNGVADRGSPELLRR